MTDPLLDLAIRRRILALVEAYPGLHGRELARQLGIEQSLLEYHLEPLSRSGLVALEFDGALKRAYPARRGRPVPGDQAERALLGTLRDETLLRLVLEILNAGAVAHKHLGERVGLSKSLTSYHLEKLRRRGIVQKRDDGLFTLVRPAAVEEVLLRHHPTPTFIKRFLALWTEFYGNA